MNTVPLIPSSSAGPLGIKHLPRLWLKVSLRNQGKLPKDYHAIGPGFDRMTLDMLGIESEAFENYIARDHPSYIELETWILNEYGEELDASKIAAHNRIIETYQHDDDTRAMILDEAGLKDDESIKTASMLNDIEDWTIFHHSFLA